ncbi:MAG: OmpA family protein [Gammaproteobacteria bacterium]|jgi:outer membrane protein OmpA-like peptidoglycan-associated protein
MNHPTTRSARLTLVALVASAVAAAGCQTLDPYTGEQKTSNTTKGAAIGAVAGTIGGIIVGGSRKQVLIGAGIGALVGAGVGSYMDRQEKELRERLEATGVSVTRSGDYIILNMPGNVTFDTNSSDINSSFYPVLDSVAIVVNKYEKTYVDVIGFTDSTGTMAINQPLSERRAGSVASYLESQQVLPQRLVVTGRGPSNPVASNDTPEGRALNRRVEIVLTPLT